MRSRVRALSLDEEAVTQGSEGDHGELLAGRLGVQAIVVPSVEPIPRQS
jgi:hypothetical protein